jgi:hypothetical protein
MRTATTTPEAAVIAATTQTAARSPQRSATMPARTAPTAKPPSRQEDGRRPDGGQLVVVRPMKGDGHLIGARRIVG